MNGPLFFAVLMAVVLAFGIAMFWQESRRFTPSETIYGIEESIEFIWLALGEQRDGLTKGDVRRILEWEMLYLQQPHLWESDGAPVIGGEAAAAYAQERALEGGHAYTPQQIYAVLDLQAAYLDAIGAIGTEAEPGELE